MKNKLSTNFMLLLVAMIWGFAFVAQKSSDVGPFTFTGIRFVIGSISLIPVVFIFERKEILNKQRVKNTFIYGFITGIILFGASALQHFGIVYVEQASKAGFIIGTYTVLVPVFGIFMGKKININIWIGAILSIVGIYLISVIGTPVLEFADLILFASAICWAFHVIVIGKYVDKVNPIMYSFVQFLTVAILSIACAIIFENKLFSVNDVKDSVIPLLYMGILSSGVAYTLQVLGQKNAEPTIAAIIFSSEPVFCTIGCVVLLGDKLTLPVITGCILIFAGIILSQCDFKIKKQ